MPQPYLVTTDCFSIAAFGNCNASFMSVSGQQPEAELPAIARASGQGQACGRASKQPCRGPGCLLDFPPPAFHLQPLPAEPLSHPTCLPSQLNLALGAPAALLPYVGSRIWRSWSSTTASARSAAGAAPAAWRPPRSCRSSGPPDSCRRAAAWGGPSIRNPPFCKSRLGCQLRENSCAVVRPGVWPASRSQFP